MKSPKRWRTCAYMSSYMRTTRPINVKLYGLVCVFFSSLVLFLLSFHYTIFEDERAQDVSVRSQALPYYVNTGRLNHEQNEFRVLSVLKNSRSTLTFVNTSHKSDLFPVPHSNHLHEHSRTFISKNEHDIAVELIQEYHHNTTHPRTLFSCPKLIEGDITEQDNYKRWISATTIVGGRPQNRKFTTVSEAVVPIMMSDCAAFRRIRGYQNNTGSEQERTFPLAHVILVHRDFEHLERLLRLLYMPQHVYCIHVDKKASERLKQAVDTYARCFTNIFIAPKPQSVVYAHISRLFADITCMQELLRRGKTWRYLINYAATELPLRTNLETVEILRTMHGLNDIHEAYKSRVTSRFEWSYFVIHGKMTATKVKLPPAPHNITVVKGQAYNTYSRSFLEWAFNNTQARDLLHWSIKTYSPDEHFWATLNNLHHNTHLQSPGGFKGDPDRKGYLTKFIIWAYKNGRFKCHGKAIRNICNFNALDLPTIVSQHHLAANKFDLTLDSVAYSCLEGLIEKRTIKPDPLFDIRKYASLYFIRSSLLGHKKTKHS